MGGDEPSARDDAGSEIERAKADAVANAGSALPTIVSGSLRSRPLSTHAAEAVLDKLNRGVVIFDADGVVHYANDAALRAAHASEAISIVDGRLGFGEPAAQARFEAFLQQGRERSNGGTGQPSVVMRVSPGAARGVRGRGCFIVLWGLLFGGGPLFIAWSNAAGGQLHLLVPATLIVVALAALFLGWKYGKSFGNGKGRGSRSGGLSDWNWSSGGFSSGGSSGGFGGGSSGGGGASGSW